MQCTTMSFQDRLDEVDGPGTILSTSMDEDYLAHGQGFVMVGVARDAEGREVHVFQRPAQDVDARPAVSPHDPNLVDVRIEPTTIEGDIRRLRAAISECRGWNEWLRMFTFCGSMTRVLEELESLRASAEKH
jgi:hypothetical protein